MGLVLVVGVVTCMPCELSVVLKIEGFVEESTTHLMFAVVIQSRDIIILTP